MKKEEYKELVNKIKPKENRSLNAFRAFLVGGLIGLIGQIISYVLVSYFNINELDSYKIVCLIVVFITCLLTSLSVFDNLISFGKCGFIIPTTGFAHSISSCTLDYKKEGLIYGFGSNVFKLAGSVILYGVVSAYVFGLIRYLLFGG